MISGAAEQGKGNAYSDFPATRSELHLPMNRNDRELNRYREFLILERVPFLYRIGDEISNDFGKCPRRESDSSVPRDLHLLVSPTRSPHLHERDFKISSQQRNATHGQFIFHPRLSRER